MPKKDIIPGVEVETLAAGPNLQVCRVALAKGSLVPEHTHPNEQTSYVERGELRYVVSGTVTVLNRGDALVIPGGAPHSCEALEDTVDINTFYPVRPEYM